jgi:hypothetical protein
MFDNWITGYISLGKNTSEIDIKVNSKYDVTTYRKRDNLFSKYKLYTNVKLYNPYETTEDLLIINDDIKRKRFNVSVFVGPIITDNLNIKIGVGLGLGYTIFEF